MAGRCITQDGFGLAGSASALIAFVVLATALGITLPVFQVELAVAFGLLVATAGFGLESLQTPGEHVRFGYGSYIGFVMAEALFVLTLARTRWPELRSSQLLKMLPAVVAVGLAAIIAVPWWPLAAKHLPRNQQFVGFSWLSLAAALGAIHLAGAWLRHAAGERNDLELLTLPLALAVVVLLAAVPLPTVYLNWDAAVLLGLAIALMLGAAAELRVGLDKLRVPEILRIDRL